MNIMRRPHSILEVSQNINNEVEDFTFALSNFLDQYYFVKDKAERAKMLSEEPLPIDSKSKYYEWWMDAYLAGVAEYLATIDGNKSPTWVNKEDKFLRRAYFANSGLTSLNAMLYVESPTSFRRRFIFTERKPLRRV